MNARPLTRWTGVAAMAMAALSVAHAEPEPVAMPPALAASATLAALPVPAAVPSGPSWALRLPKTEPVLFRGVVNLDNAGSGPGAMLYPAPGVAGLLAAIVTHGVIMESVKSAEKTRLQTEADQVLAPYQEWLKGFQHRELMQKGLEKTALGERKRLADVGSEDGNDWLIDSTPVYSMTQDRSALILDNILTIRRPGALGAVPYQNTVRVVSQSRTADDLQAVWGADQGALLKEESVRLFAQSLDMGLADAQKPSSAASRAHKTVRYLEGQQEKMERGEVLDDRCGRVVIKTLRGWLMSVPAQSPSTAAGASSCS